jgi:hypothetical protein
MVISPFGQLNDNGDDGNKPVRPTCAVGALLSGARRMHINHICFYMTFLSWRTRDVHVRARKHPDMWCSASFHIGQ